MSLPASGLIKEGDKVILRKGNNMQSVQVTRKRKYNLEKMWFILDGAIGKPYGTTFETKGNTVIPVEKEQAEETDLTTDADDVSGKDNRNLLDKRANQKLSREEIESMRKEGISGQNIIDQLVENSATFKDKTEFAQQKYIKKKKIKHLNRFTVLKPCTRLLAEMYFNKGPTKICNLRMDSLAQMLAYANVHAGCQVLVVESCCGLVAGSVVERLGGQGLVMHLYTGNAPVWSAVQSYNFSEEVLGILLKYPLKELTAVKKETENKPIESCTVVPPESKKPKCDNLESSDNEHEDVSENIIEQVSMSEDCEELPVSKEEDIEEKGNGDEEDLNESNIEEKKGLKRKRDPEKEEQIEQRRKERLQEIEKSRLILQKGNFDSLIMACRHHPSPILMNTIDYLGSSRPFVIFSPYQQALMDCYIRLRDRGGIANLRLTETWLRQYQVLPNRTHPEINMSNYSGYLLTGITTLVDENQAK